MTDDANAVQTAVQRYFSAWAAGERTEGLATSPLAAVDALFFAARSPAGARSVEIRGLEVERIGATAAIAAIDATLIRRIGERTFETDLSGPVELQRIDDTWRVARYVREGAPVAATLVHEAHARAGSVTLAARAVEFRGHSTGIVIEARNESDDEARFLGAKLVSHLFVFRSRRRIRRGVSRGRLGGIIPAHGTVFREAVVPPIAKERSRRRLVLRVRLEQGGQQHKTRLEVGP